MTCDVKFPAFDPEYEIPADDPNTYSCAYCTRTYHSGAVIFVFDGAFFCDEECYGAYELDKRIDTYQENLEDFYS